MTTSKTSGFGAKSKCRGEEAPYLCGPRSQPRLLRVTVHTADLGHKQTLWIRNKN